jgi:phage-related protein
MAKDGIKVHIYGDYDDKDIRKLQKDLESLKKQSTTVSEKFTKFGDGLASFGKKMSLFATLPIAAFGVAAFKAAQEAEQADKRIAQIAKSMGLVSGAYAGGLKRLDDYSNSLMKQIGVEDESIKQVQAKLLTFKALGATMNQAGGAMDRATQAAYDLASAGFGSAESNATQLGKALQDPVKGLTALTRSGVTFTAAEKDRIKAMVAAGDTAAAQNLILKAIESQVGGTAAATVTDTQKMSVAWGELQENFGKAILPIITTISQKIIPFLENLTNKFTALSPGAKTAIVAFAAFVAAIGPVSFIVGKTITGIVGAKDAIVSMSGVVTKAVGGLQNFATGFSNANAAQSAFATNLTKFGGYVSSAVSAVTTFTINLAKQTAALIVQGAQWVATTAAMVAHKVASVAMAAATVVMTGAQYALNTAMLANPIGLIIVALIAFGAALVVLYNKSETFRNILVGAWDAIKNGFGVLWNFVRQILGTWVQVWTNVVGKIIEGAALMFGWIPGIGPKLKEASNKFKDFADDVVNKIKGTEEPAGKSGEAAGKNYVNGFKTGAENVPTVIQKVGTKVTTTLGKAIVKEAVQQGPVTGAAAVSGLLGTQGAVNAAYAAGAGVGVAYNNGVASVVTNTLGAQNTGVSMTSFEDSARNIAKGMGAATAKIFAEKPVVDTIADPVAKGVKSAVESIKDKLRGTFSDWFKEGLDKLKTQLKDAEKAFDDFKNTVSNAINGAINFSDAAQEFDEQGNKVGKSFIDKLTEQAEQAKNFASKVRELIAAGLSKEALTQVLAAGVTAGTNIAKELIAGGATAIGTTNDLVSATQLAADEVGTLAATNWFGAGVKSADETLKGFQSEFGAKGASRAKILRVMDNLAESMNRNATITVTTVNRIVTENIPATTFGGFRAAGGPVSASAAYVVGENGPEVFVPSASGQIVPNIGAASTMSGMGSGSSNNSAGNSYSINVNTGVGDPRRIGEEIVSLITRFEKANGPVYAKAV